MFEENGMFDKFALAVWQKVTGIDTTCLNWPRIESDWEEIAVQPFYFSPEYIFCPIVLTTAGYSQLDGVPGQVGGDAGEPLVGAVYGGAAAHAGLGAAAGPGHQHQHQQAAEAGLHGEASHRVTLAGVSSGHWSHGHGAGNGHHWCSHGVTRCRCPLSCFSPHGRLSTELYRAGAAARGRGRRPQCRHPPSVQPGTG